MGIRLAINLSLLVSMGVRVLTFLMIRFLVTWLRMLVTLGRLLCSCVVWVCMLLDSSSLWIGMVSSLLGVRVRSCRLVIVKAWILLIALF